MPTKLGQHFLKDTSIIKRILATANLRLNDFIIEIGPGEGILTEKLAEKVKQVIAIEIDNNLIPALQKKFANNKKVEIIHEDILKINIRSLDKLGMTSFYKVVANIPYYITSKIIRLFLESETPPQEMILMVQKEVAERIVEKPGKMSILALSVQYYAEAQILFSVPAKAFFPIPKVDSTVIKIFPSQQIRSQEETKKFFRVVRAGFSAKRKTLANNLANSFHLAKKDMENKLNQIGLSSLARAQELSLEEWKKLAKVI
jgi:16S rRNA (adenine1518-N6/adenine1519-N6)-dimethyltransferase